MVFWCGKLLDSSPGIALHMGMSPVKQKSNAKRAQSCKNGMAALANVFVHTFSNIFLGQGLV